MEELAPIQSQKQRLSHCPVCRSASLQSVIEFSQLPVLSNVLWDKREEAIMAPRGNIRLVFCETCGHVFNQAFNPRLMNYDVKYENSLHFSQVFQNYATWLAQHLVDAYDLRRKSIIEIGSGKGEFLNMLCEYGDNIGIGFDPSYEPSADQTPARIRFIKDRYSKQYSSYQADLVLSRHVLEHIDQPAEFIQNLRQTIGDRIETVVFCEVPNMGYILRDTAIWDIIYEHFSYFSAHSLAEIFTRHDFRVMNLAEAFHGQFLYIEAVPQNSGHTSPTTLNQQPVEGLANEISGFTSRSQEKISRWNDQIQNLRASKKRVVLWGAGSKGISFLNMIPVEDVIEYIVDISPRKRGKFVTGAGQQIVSPEYLKQYRPDTIIILNPVYQQEIQAILDRLELRAEFLFAS